MEKDTSKEGSNLKKENEETLEIHPSGYGYVYVSNNNKDEQETNMKKNEEEE